MSDARSYFTCPGGVWRRDAALNGCREDSITIFKLIAEASDRDWRIEVSPSNHAFSVRQCILDPDRFRRWSEERINRALAELRARGCLLLATSCDREWLEVSDRLAYCKGHKKQEPLKPPEQVPLLTTSEMPLFALPQPRIPVRAESEKEKDTESARERANVPAPVPRNESGTRERSRGRYSGEKRFARDEDAIPDDALWSSLCRAVGLTEMTANGAMWVKRYRLCRDALAVAVRDFVSLTPEHRKKWNAAAYITTAFESEKQKFGTR